MEEDKEEKKEEKEEELELVITDLQYCLLLHYASENTTEIKNSLIISNSSILIK